MHLKINNCNNVMLIAMVAIVHKKLTIGVVLKMFSIAVVQIKVISCNSANKSCLLQVLQTKAIAALAQFCNFLIILVHSKP